MILYFDLLVVGGLLESIAAGFGLYLWGIIVGYALSDVYFGLVSLLDIATVGFVWCGDCFVLQFCVWVQVCYFSSTVLRYFVLYYEVFVFTPFSVYFKVIFCL